MHNKMTKRIHLTFYLMMHWGISISVQLRVLLMVHLKARLHLRLKLRVHLRLQWVALEDAHGGALVSAKKYAKQFNKRWTWRGTHVALQGAPKILRSTIRCKKKVKKKMHLTLQVMVHLTVQTKLCLTWISNSALYRSFISKIVQNKLNC